MLQNVHAVLLAGGMGSRLRSVVSSVPKPLASVGGRPFLELLIRQLRHQGIRDIVMCTGYLGDQIESEFGGGEAWDVEIRYSRELHALGTAGAVKLAGRYLHDAADFLVLNGDSFLKVDFDRLLGFHREHQGLISMAVRAVENVRRYGSVQVDSSGRITGFAEKSAGDMPGIVNAGVYVFKRVVLDYIPETPASLEKDVFPRLLTFGVYALEQDGMFIDIGTPEDYARAQAICSTLFDAAST